MYLKKIVAIIMIVLCHYAVFAQEGTVTLEGTITSKDEGIPIAGVNVFILGEKLGTTTNFNGYYQLKVKKDAILSFSSTGKKTVTTSLSGRTTINVVMEEKASTLEQVIVIGYKTSRKSSLTDAASKLENKNVDELASSNISNSIKGKIAGVQIKNKTANVNDDTQILVRGIESISLNSPPLIIVDGFPFENGLKNISPNAIKSIEVLKSTQSAAIYGSMGANGVIIITTKDHKTEKTSSRFKTFSNSKKASRQLDLLDTIKHPDVGVVRNKKVSGLTERDTSLN